MLVKGKSSSRGKMAEPNGTRFCDFVSGGTGEYDGRNSVKFPSAVLQAGNPAYSGRRVVRSAIWGRYGCQSYCTTWEVSWLHRFRVVKSHQSIGRQRVPSPTDCLGIRVAVVYVGKRRSRIVEAEVERGRNTVKGRPSRLAEIATESANRPREGPLAMMGDLSIWTWVICLPYYPPLVFRKRCRLPKEITKIVPTISLVFTIRCLEGRPYKSGPIAKKQWSNTKKAQSSRREPRVDSFSSLSQVTTLVIHW